MYEMADGDIMATTYSDMLMCYMLEGTYYTPPINTLMISRIKIFCFMLILFISAHAGFLDITAPPPSYKAAVFMLLHTCSVLVPCTIEYVVMTFLGLNEILNTRFKGRILRRRPLLEVKTLLEFYECVDCSG